MLLSLLLLTSDLVRTFPAGWEVYENDQNCAVMRSYDGGAVLRVAYTQSTDVARFQIIDPAFKSIEADKSYKLKLVFVRGGNVDTGWGEQTATGFKLDDANGFTMTLRGDDLLTDLVKNDAVGVFNAETLVDSLKLDGSAPAIAGLQACALQLQKKKPIDPFAE